MSELLSHVPHITAWHLSERGLETQRHPCPLQPLHLCFQVKLESNFAAVVFAIMVLEGLARSLDPELDILEAAKPLLIKTAASLS